MKEIDKRRKTDREINIKVDKVWKGIRKHIHKLFLYIPQRYKGGVKVQLHSFLTSALDGGQWLTPRFNRFIPGKLRRYPWLGGWLGLHHAPKLLQRLRIRPQHDYKFSYTLKYVKILWAG